MVSTDKDPAKVRAGQIGARRRWGEQRVIHLDQLSPEQARLVRALVAAAKAARADQAGPGDPPDPAA